MELDGVFIDMYGTLTTGDRAAVEEVCASIVADLALPLDAREFSIRWGDQFFATLDTFTTPDNFLTLFDAEVKSLEDTLAAHDRQADAQSYVRQLTDYWRNPPLQPDTRQFLAEFPYPVCIVSNADRVDLEVALERLALTVDDVVTSDDVRSYKPQTPIFDAALEKTGWRRSHVIHVGDSLHADVDGAHRAGLRSGWVNRAHRIHDIGTSEPDHEFETLLDLVKLVRNSQPVQ
ncbi:MAG: HAD family hydrolase [Phycisphaerae bacterium]|nr:HAD family hydrolase [Phycisphaerae bacterium]